MSHGPRRSLPTRAVETVLALLMLLLIGLVSAQIFMRYVMHSPLTWSEELARMTFVYLTFIGAGLALHRRSSVARMRGVGRTAYAIAKAGVIGFVRPVAVQLAPKGIRVNAIAAGPVWTPMVEDLGPEAREVRRRSTPLATEGTGWGAVYLASDEARWVTGQTLVIDAGFTLTTRGGLQPPGAGAARS